jgi:hypothetical protein
VGIEVEPTFAANRARISGPQNERDCGYPSLLVLVLVLLLELESSMV